MPAILRGGWELDESGEGEGSVQQGVISHFVNATTCSYVEADFFSIRKLCDRETERSKQKREPLSCPALGPLRVLSLSAAHTHWEDELWSKSRLDQSWLSSPSSGRQCWWGGEREVEWIQPHRAIMSSCHSSFQATLSVLPWLLSAKSTFVMLRRVFSTHLDVTGITRVHEKGETHKSAHRQAGYPVMRLIQVSFGLFLSSKLKMI